MSLRKGNTLISGAGIDGQNGTNGQDGFSPSASVSKVGSVSTLTVTDANGTTTTQILDGGQIIQYPVVPTASVDNLGQIIQFTGTTDSTYTNGYFYKCVENGGTYSWESINVQVNPKAEVKGIHIADGNDINHSYTTSIVQVSVDYFYNTDVIIEALNDAYEHYVANKTNYMNITYIGMGIKACRFTLPAPIENGTPQFTFYSETTIEGYGNIYYSQSRMTVTFTNYKVTSFSKYANQTNLRALGTSNTTSYTPTADSYKPATAKYAEQMVQSVAAVYSSSSTYAVGDYVSYQGKLYVCNTAISSAESWTAAHWTETTVMSIVGNLETALSNITTGNGV